LGRSLRPSAGKGNSAFGKHTFHAFEAGTARAA
jgi:hypothetical protein